MQQVATGKVRFFDYRGYGFIIPSDNGPDVYFHASELPGNAGKRWVADGALVSFEVSSRKGKPCANKVCILENPEVEDVETPASTKNGVE
jgi:cold shock CspA family protein